MSELIAGTPPETEPQELFDHEQSAAPTAQTPLGTFEKIQRVAKSVFEAHGVLWKRGGGRPRKDGRPNKLDIPINAPANNLPAGASVGPALAPEPGLDPALVKKVCASLLKAIDGFFGGVLHRRARAAGLSPEDCRDLCVQTAITEKESDGFSELAEVCLRKYGVGTEYVPEIGLAVLAGGIAVRYATAIRALPSPDNVIKMPEGKP